VTEYQYDDQNREISRTEAAGAPEARTVTTEYHYKLNQPVKIIEPDLITEMTYDAAGHLLSTQRIPAQ
jgi:YD repeat-containing protein